MSRRFFSKIETSPLSVRDVTPAALSLYLPTHLKAHANKDAFLMATVAAVELFAHRTAGPIKTSHVQVRETLKKINVDAHRMQNALQSLAGGTAAFSALKPHACYLLFRARKKIKQSKDQPVVPEMHTTALNFPSMLERLTEDLTALRVICVHVSGITQSDQHPQKGHERLLVQQLVEAHKRYFGTLPPKRGWFANDLLNFVSQCVGLAIGHRIVGEVVEGMQ